MKLNIPKEIFDSLMDGEKGVLKYNYRFNGTDLCWHSKPDVDIDTAFRVGQEIGIYPSVIWAPTKEKYMSLPDEEKTKIKELLEYKKKQTVWESKPLKGRAAYEYLISIGEHPSYDTEHALEVRLLAGIELLKSSDAYKHWLDTMSRFTSYSPRNMMLIAAQCPDATHVAGRAKWWNAFKRSVVQNAKGLYIIAPQTKLIGVPTKEEEERIKRGEMKESDVPKQKVLTGFMPMTVYDISETKGEPLPESPARQLSGDALNYTALKKAITKTLDFDVAEVNPNELRQGVNGCCNFENRQILIKNDMPQAQKLKTLLHEFAHANLHDKNINPEVADYENNMKEIQAESTAYILCSKYGVDASDYSFGYIAGWSECYTLSELAKVLTGAAEAAHMLAEKIDKELEKAMQQEQQTAEPEEAKHAAQMKNERFALASIEDPLSDKTVYSVWDNEINDYCMNSHGQKLTYRSAEEANAHLEKLKNGFSLNEPESIGFEMELKLEM